MIFETILEPVFFTVGSFFIKLFTIGKQPTNFAKERYRVPIEFFGGAVSIITIFLFLLILFYVTPISYTILYGFLVYGVELLMQRRLGIF